MLGGSMGSSLFAQKLNYFASVSDPGVFIKDHWQCIWQRHRKRNHSRSYYRHYFWRSGCHCLCSRIWRRSCRGYGYNLNGFLWNCKVPQSEVIWCLILQMAANGEQLTSGANLLTRPHPCISSRPSIARWGYINFLCLFSFRTGGGLYSQWINCVCFRL